MLRYGSPQLGFYRPHVSRPYVNEWMSRNKPGLLGLGVTVEQPEVRTLPWQIGTEDPRDVRAEKWSSAATIVGVLAGLASVAALTGLVGR
ncbi:MAG: hypothetical protein V3U45_03830 [bacterium]